MLYIVEFKDDNDNDDVDDVLSLKTGKEVSREITLVISHPVDLKMTDSMISYCTFRSSLESC